MQVTPVQSHGAMMSAARTVLICGGSFLGNMWVMMSVVHTVVWALPANGMDKHAACGMDRSPPTSRMDMSLLAGRMDRSQ
jgi:hypothetical protein